MMSEKVSNQPGKKKQEVMPGLPESIRHYIVQPENINKSRQKQGAENNKQKVQWPDAKYSFEVKSFDTNSSVLSVFFQQQIGD